MRFLKLILTIFVIITAYIGDYIVFSSKYSSSQAFRAITDSIVHATIGFLSAFLFFSYEHNLTIRARVYNVMFCTIISSLIDIDHVFVARSFYLKDLSGLKQRGIFHCTTFWILITIILLLYSYIKKKINIYVLTFMLMLAYSSHHVRDANRRGIWLYPFGHGPPLSKSLYIFIVAVTPHILAYIYALFIADFYKSVVVDYSMVI